MLDTKIAEFLGEENEKRLKDGITDMLLERAQTDIDEKYKYEYIIAFDYIYEEVAKEIEKEVKEKLKGKYMKMLEEKMANM